MIEKVKRTYFPKFSPSKILNLSIPSKETFETKNDDKLEKKQATTHFKIKKKFNGEDALNKTL